jgi:hypothetical protein
MYEPYLLIGRIKVSDDTLILPVITEHIDYNGYEIGSHAKKYWRETHNMISVDLRDRTTGELFGSYPPVYRQKNIPVFSEFDFDVVDGKLYTTFAADSLIYVRDVRDGRLLYGFGCAAQGVSHSYPATGTFEEYEEVYDKQREAYGYYTQLAYAGGYLFRGYKKEGVEGFGLQMYRGEELIGDINTDEEIRIIGEEGGVFYATLPTDLDGERFRIVRFTLPDVSAPEPLSLSADVCEEAKLVFMDKRIVKADNVKTGTVFKKEIRIRNEGDANLLILNYKLSCKCTKATLPKVLKPGEEGEIIIEIDTTDKSGKSTNTLLFETNTIQRDYVIRVDLNVVT